MSKSVLILDTPKSCKDCMFCFELEDNTEACCSVVDDDADSSMCKKLDFKDKYWKRKPTWCPLKEIPEEIHNEYYLDEYCDGYDDGWNTLRKFILGVYDYV